MVHLLLTQDRHCPKNRVTSRLPRYRETTRTIAEALSIGRPQDLFDPVWLHRDNAIANAGQGMLKADTAKAMREELVQVIEDIHKDGSSTNFQRIVGRFDHWKSQSRIHMVPRLMIARAFAGVHPKQFHTIVDERSHDHALAWFAEHTNFVIPNSDNWAARAQALVEHLNRLSVFGNDILTRNIFPWFVVDQLRARTTRPVFRARHTDRQHTAIASISQAQRIMELRHNKVQIALYKLLVAQYGEGKVGTECETGTGGLADAVAEMADGSLNLYEIKIAHTAAAVVRQAMGQLLEYGFRKGGLEPVKLIAVGEPPLDSVTTQFIERLRSDFRINIAYMQVSVPESIDASSLAKNEAPWSSPEWI